MPISEAYLMDNMEYMAGIPDGFFDLAVVDPPYGDGGGGYFSGETRFGGIFDRYKGDSEKKVVCRTGGGYATKFGKKIIAWDNAPEQIYFDELFRISKDQIIWGANCFSMPPCRCFLIWKKLTISESFTMAMAEYAWTSFNNNAKIFEYAPQGTKEDPRTHPTQKPIALYDWTYSLFAKPGMKIFDSHLGSGSNRISAYKAGLDFYSCEIDSQYFNDQEKRFKEFLMKYGTADISKALQGQQLNFNL